MRYFYFILASVVLFMSFIVYKNLKLTDYSKFKIPWFRRRGRLPEMRKLESWIIKNFGELSEGLVKKIVSSVKIISDNILDKHGINFLASLNGGKESVVVLDLIILTLSLMDTSLSEEKNVKVFCFEQEHEFPELSKFREEISKNYFRTDVDCVKTDDFRFGLSILKGKYPVLNKVFLGVRKTDPYGHIVKVVCPTTNGFPEYLRIHPLLDWDYDEVWEYILKLDIPYPKLYDEGYTSIGTTKNTKKNPRLLVKNSNGEEVYLPAYKLDDGEYERSGRE